MGISRDVFIEGRAQGMNQTNTGRFVLMINSPWLLVVAQLSELLIDSPKSRKRVLWMERWLFLMDGRTRGLFKEDAVLQSSQGSQSIRSHFDKGSPWRVCVYRHFQNYYYWFIWKDGSHFEEFLESPRSDLATRFWKHGNLNLKHFDR